MNRGRNLLLVLLVLICGVSLWLGQGGRLTFPGRGAPRAAARSPAARLANPVHLLVLNGTAEPGLARSVGLALSAAGLVPERAANAPRTGYAHSFLVNRRLDETAAGALAVRLGGLTLLKEWDARANEDAVLVLGEDRDALLAALARQP